MISVQSRTWWLHQAEGDWHLVPSPKIWTRHHSLCAHSRSSIILLMLLNSRHCFPHCALCWSSSFGMLIGRLSGSVSWWIPGIYGSRSALPIYLHTISGPLIFHHPASWFSIALLTCLTSRHYSGPLGHLISSKVLQNKLKPCVTRGSRINNWISLRVQILLIYSDLRTCLYQALIHSH